MINENVGDSVSKQNCVMIIDRKFSFLFQSKQFVDSFLFLFVVTLIWFRRGIFKKIILIIIFNFEDMGPKEDEKKQYNDHTRRAC